MSIQSQLSQQSPVGLSTAVQTILCCPICSHSLKLEPTTYHCANPECRTEFPIVHGIPILIDENSSLFSIEDFVNQRSTYRPLNQNSAQKPLRNFLRQLLPEIGKNLKSTKNYEQFVQRLLSCSSQPQVLVIGGSVLGEGSEVLLADSRLQLIESDVSFGPRTALICDAHSLPFANQSFDGVVVQAVLEHVVDPGRCCEEIHRVLKPNGLVYSETPFIQQVHGRQYDFTRFTYLGHRRLFRKFEEIESGAVCGPGMALAWSYKYFLLSFSNSQLLRKLIEVFVRFTAFYWKYFDYLLLNTPGGFDAASAYYFLGKKSQHTLSDKELIRLYKGAL